MNHSGSQKRGRDRVQWYPHGGASSSVKQLMEEKTKNNNNNYRAKINFYFFFSFAFLSHSPTAAPAAST